jgi:hypothetical protein
MKIRNYHSNKQIKISVCELLEMMGIQYVYKLCIINYILLNRIKVRKLSYMIFKIPSLIYSYSVIENSGIRT